MLPSDMSPVSLQTITERESVLLAPYAMHSAHSAGRVYPEPDHPYRGPYQRDRDRVLHSAAYRRLSDKTQVFTNMGDYYRTRLTHTQEVASISRTIGRALRLNEDLIEALALFHDIGHPPYGHAGEDALNECLADVGGFSHNQHALTIARELERRYHEFPGLNLSHEVLEGQAARTDKRKAKHCALLEVQVVDAADSITYDAHDSDDALKLGILSFEQLAEVPLVNRLVERIGPRKKQTGSEMTRLAIVHELIDIQVSDVLLATEASFADRPCTSSEAARDPQFAIGPTEEIRIQKKELESFLYEHVYRHPKLLEFRELARGRLWQMFDGFSKHPDWLPVHVQPRIDRVGLPRAIGEYLAGMTDRFCDEVHRQRFA